MTKHFYRNGLFFLGLTVVSSLLQSLLYFKIGVNLLTLTAFANFFWQETACRWFARVLCCGIIIANTTGLRF